MTVGDSKIHETPLEPPYDALRYGQTIRLHAVSHYASECKLGIGYYEKNGRHGLLSCVPPLGPELDHLFIEDEFTVMDPFHKHSIGNIVEYRHTIVLINRQNKVWNNKTGGITGYIGPRVRQISGEMFVSFVPSSIHADTNSIKYGDTNVSIHVMDSHRHSVFYNKRLTNYKKTSSKISGGYICSDGKGYELKFTILPVRSPSIASVRLQKSVINDYVYQQSVTLPGFISGSLKDMGALIQFKNGWQAETRYKDLKQYVSENKESLVKLKLSKGPGELTIKVMGEIAHAKKDGIRRCGNKSIVYYKCVRIVRTIPIPMFVLMYGMLLYVMLGWLEYAAIREVTVFVLVMILGLYVAVQWDHPYSQCLRLPEENSSLNAMERAEGGIVEIAVMEYSFSCVKGAEDRHSATRGIPVSNSAISSSTGRSSIDTDGIPVYGTDVPIPNRYLVASKGDAAKARERYLDTLSWRREKCLDSILSKPHRHFLLIKKHYPHYFHLRGKEDEPVYIEKPGRINLKALHAAGIQLDDLLENYMLVTEYLWRVIEPNDDKKCISIVDVEGIGFSDFAGDTVEYIRKAAAISEKHYPERCAFIYIINVPSWFSMIWNVVKGMVDEVTQSKIIIVRGKKQIFEALKARINIENIPIEYGGLSEGQSNEEALLYEAIKYVNGGEGAADVHPLARYLENCNF